jgi:hypothetical protein
MARKTPAKRLDALHLTDFTGTAYKIPDQSESAASVLVLMRGLW